MMAPLLILSLVLFTHLTGYLCKVTTVGDLAVLEGGSVEIPCHYEPQYASYVKYWCQGRDRGLCTSLARSDAPGRPTAEDKVVLFDDPVQQVFTVTMTNMQEADSGWYWCGVEVGGFWSADDAVSLYINVLHGLSVVNRKVRGEEGTSLTVQCLYSQRLRQNEKKWCRSGDWSSCLVTNSDGLNEDQALEIRDDHTKAFNVTFRRLVSTDTGWYWCASGQQQVAVYIQVTQQVAVHITLPATTGPGVIVTSSPEDNQSVHLPPRQIANGAENQRPLWEYSLMACGVLFIVQLLILLPWKIMDRYMKLKKRRTEEELEDRLSDPPFGDDWQNTSIIILKDPSQKMLGF
ncbi:hypothetical protein UPYG_G00303740 [Umbra pygmaea]|uniref:Ig-like domain-containing protein n=1 Tax=Umbra pygmaea TaxID=75934 RepID=A0ABD0W782_UMBPY